MRTHSVLVAFAMAFVVLLGLVFLPFQIVEASVSIGVDVDPDTLNLEMHGRWITVYVETLDEYEVSDINISAVTLEGMLLPERWRLQDDRLMMKFYAEDVITLVWLKISHMGTPVLPEVVELTVFGEFHDGTPFEGSDEIWVIAPSL